MPYVMGVAVLMQTADMTMIAPALPRLAVYFGIDTIASTLAMTAYLLGMAVLSPVGGWLADRYGGRNVYRFAMLLQAAAVIGCALAPTFAWLVTCRFLSGLACSPMLSVSRLMIVRATPPERRVSAIASYSMMGLLGPLLAPPVGGLLVDLFDWQAVPLAMLPLGLAVGTAITFFTEDDGHRSLAPLDIGGLLLSGISLGALVGAIEVLGHGLSGPLALALGTGGVVGIAALTVHARRASHPLVRLDLLRRKVLRLSLLADITTRMLLPSCAMLVSLQQQVGLHRSASLAGGLMLLPGFGQLIVKPTITFSVRLAGVRRAMMAWSCANSIAFGLVALFPTVVIPLAMLLLAIHGLGRSVVLNLGTILNYTDVEADEMGAVTSLTAMAQQLALVFGLGFSSLLLRIYSGPHGNVELRGVCLTMLTMGGVALISAVACRALPPEAGRARAS